MRGPGRRTGEARVDASNLTLRIDEEEAERNLESTWSGGQSVSGQSVSGMAVQQQFQDHGQSQERVIQGTKTQGPVKPIVNEQPKLGRKDPCHCGSGRKYKKCHGKDEA